MSQFPSSVTNLIDQPSACPVSEDEAGASIRFEAPAGLYQFSVVADASDFDWEELYIQLDRFHNDNVRTGPWDFDLTNNNKPLVPSYWVYLDGQRIGLWYFQRVSLEDIEQRRFRGRMAVWLQEPGQHELRWEPYRPLTISWISARLERDPDDSLAPLPEGLRPAADCISEAHWSDPAFVADLRDKLAGSHAFFRPLLDCCFEQATEKDESQPHHLPALGLARYLDDREELTPRALATIDQALALPAWGNPNPEGYGYNGDMGAMSVLLNLARSLHIWGPQLGDERRQRMLDKLARQGDIFLEQALLNRDYWGGSLLQDHGWKSHWGMATAALMLVGELPAAERWLRYCLPRVRRALDAIPRDGAIPPSSYGVPWLYVDLPAHFRRTLLAMGGGDIYDKGLLYPVVDFLLQVYDSEHKVMATGRLGDVLPATGGYTFLLQMASLHHDRQAAWLAREYLSTSADSFYHASQRDGFYSEMPWAVLDNDATVVPEPPPAPLSRLSYFPDSGLAHAQAGDLTLRVECGPGNGYHSYVNATGPCDRLTYAASAGHFSLALRGKPLLVTPDSGYRIKTFLGTALLIDGCGQKDDVGYPMSLPSAVYKGEYIAFAKHSEDEQAIRLRLDLSTVYADELGVASYTRDLLMSSGRVVCRDAITLDAPRQLAWLFQGKPDFGIELDGQTGRFGQADNLLLLQPQAVDLELAASLEPTQVVWSYASASGFKPFAHVRYATREPVQAATVDFVFAVAAD